MLIQDQCTTASLPCPLAKREHSPGALPHQQADRRERDGAAGLEQAEVADFLNALGQHVLQAPPEQLQDVEVGGAGTRTAPLPRGEGDGTVLEADDAAVGDGEPEERRGEGGEGGVALVMGLALDVPGDRPDRRIALLQQTGSAHGVFEERTGDGRERCDRDKAVGAGGAPGRAVRGEAAARNDGVDMGVGRPRPAPGRQDTGEAREVGADQALVCGELLEGHGRRLTQGVVREALMRADQGA
jgi:hypothetical protein